MEILKMESISILRAGKCKFERSIVFIVSASGLSKVESMGLVGQIVAKILSIYHNS
jgi:hypothetical protein